MALTFRNAGLGDFKDTNELVAKLLDAARRLEDGELTVPVAKGMAELAKTTVEVIKNQLFYDNMTGRKSNIDFLEACHKSDDTKRLSPAKGK